MSGLIWLLEAVLLGSLLVHRFADLRAVQPGWARWLLVFGAGALGGIGLASFLFFLCGALLGIPLAAMGLELGLVVWMGYAWFRRRVPVPEGTPRAPSPLIVPLSGGLLLVVGIATVAMGLAWGANPHGNWDAWAIWNFRARFLAVGGGLASRAWSPALAATSHPGYPLLVSAFVARCWAFSHSFSPTVPEATAYVFFLGLIAVVAGGVAALRGAILGLMAALVLAATPSLLHEVPTQYADVPLAGYFVAAMVFALLDRPWLGGVFAGFAAWTKDEGFLFLILFLAATAVFRRRDVPAAAAGALPGAALAVLFKTFVSSGGAPQIATSLPAAAQHIADAGRYATVAAAFGREFIGLGTGWYHPLLPLIVLAAALRFEGKYRSQAAFCWTMTATLLAGFFGVYIFTSNDLTFMLQTSLNRLLVQAWPVLVLAAFVSLRVPEIAAGVKATPGVRRRDRAGRAARR